MPKPAFSALTAKHLVVRTSTPDHPTYPSPQPKNENAFQWKSIQAEFQKETPLWFYLLAEAQAPITEAIPGDAEGRFWEAELLNGPGALTQLGWVGGRIIAEVFYALIDDDKDSFVNRKDAAHWKPRIGDGGGLRVRDLLEFG